MDKSLSAIFSDWDVIDEQDAETCWEFELLNLDGGCVISVAKWILSADAELSSVSTVCLVTCRDSVQDALPEHSQSRKIPQELGAAIMNYLYDDKQTLKTCSLVCRDWLLPSSVHLFQLIVWPPKRSKFCVSDVEVQSCHGVCLRNLSNSGRLSQVVRTLHLTKNPCTNRQVHRFLNLNFIGNILCRLPQLHTLKCVGCELLSLPAVVKPKAPFALQEFHYVWHVRANIAPMLQFLTALPRLSKVAVSEPQTRIVADDIIPILPSSMRTLKVDALELDSEMLVYSLASIIELKSIRSFSLYRSELTQICVTFMRSMSNLISLAFFTTATSAELRLPRVRLHSLTIYGHFYIQNSTDRSQSDWEYIMRDLGPLANSDLRELNIGMLITTDCGLEGHDLLVRIDDHLTKLDWCLLAQNLSICHSLETLQIGIKLGKEDADSILLSVVHDIIVKKLPDWLRNILQVVHLAQHDISANSSWFFDT
jgi:hypothetical protein